MTELEFVEVEDWFIEIRNDDNDEYRQIAVLNSNASLIAEFNVWLP